MQPQHLYCAKETKTQTKVCTYKIYLIFTQPLNDCAIFLTQHAFKRLCKNHIYNMQHLCCAKAPKTQTKVCAYNNLPNFHTSGRFNYNLNIVDLYRNGIVIVNLVPCPDDVSKVYEAPISFVRSPIPESPSPFLFLAEFRSNPLPSSFI